MSWGFSESQRIPNAKDLASLIQEAVDSEPDAAATGVASAVA